MGLMLQISTGTFCPRLHWGPLPYLGHGAAALLCLGPLEQKMRVQGGTLEKYQLGIGSLAQEGLHFQGTVDDSLSPLCRGDPVPLTQVMLTAGGLFLTPSLLSCLGWGCRGWAELCSCHSFSLPPERLEFPSQPHPHVNPSPWPIKLWLN